MTQFASDTMRSIDNMLNPSSVAVVGATERLQYGGRFLRSIMPAKDKVRIYPVNPKYDKVLGMRCYPTVLDLPEVPDLVSVIVPQDHVMQVLEESAQIGVKAAIVISAGFSERGDLSYPYFPNAHALAEACDVLALTRPGGEATMKLVDGDVLAALGTKGYLINIARGSVVDEAALVKALSENTIAGAGLDVFADEPNAPEALFPFDHVVLQPHQASATVETRTAMGDLTIKNLTAHFAGQPLPNQVA